MEHIEQSRPKSLKRIWAVVVNWNSDIPDKFRSGKGERVLLESLADEWKGNKERPRFLQESRYLYLCLNKIVKSYRRLATTYPLQVLTDRIKSNTDSTF